MLSFLRILKSRKTLTLAEAYALQKSILEGKVSTQELLEIFSLLDRPLASDEFYGFYQASADSMIKIHSASVLLDTCGTGGDGLKTFNISTVAALLCAALGVPVAKHGNRSASGRCGSADVLEQLGVNIDLSAQQVAQCITKTGFGFMFAQKFHPSFKHSAAARKLFGQRTYFNFLGPLLNPAGAAFRLIGICDSEIAELMGRTLVKIGIKKAWIVHSHEGMDEISAAGKTDIMEFAQRAGVKKLAINPVEYGFKLVPLSKLVGGDSKINAEIIRKVLSNRGSIAQTNALVLNAAAGLYVAGRTKTYAEGIKMAKQGIRQKLGLKKLDQVIQLTSQYQHIG
jgi:anthranilate phosphoribosyltransferase